MAKAATLLKEKERVRRVRDEPEKVVKQWEREQAESEKDTEDELSNEEPLTITVNGQEDNGKREKEEKTSSTRRKELGAMGRDSGGVAQRLSGELGIRSGEGAGGKVSEVSRRESREIYRRPSDLDQQNSEFIEGELEGQEEKFSEVVRRELEELGEIELGEKGGMKTESAENMEEDEKEDE